MRNVQNKVSRLHGRRLVIKRFSGEVDFEEDELKRRRQPGKFYPWMVQLANGRRASSSMSTSFVPKFSMAVDTLPIQDNQASKNPTVLPEASASEEEEADGMFQSQTSQTSQTSQSTQSSQGKLSEV